MPTILLINPNTSAATTGMMLAVAAPFLPPHVGIRAVTAAAGVGMILDEAGLAVSAAEVVRLGAGCDADAVVVAAFGNPGAAALRARLSVPVMGIGEAAIREAAWDGRRFGIATTTPGLRAAIEAAVEELGLGLGFTGLRLTAGDPLALAADPAAQDAALTQAALACVAEDGAEAVVIGGGPLSGTAARLRGRMGVPVIEPVPAAIRAVLALL